MSMHINLIEDGFGARGRRGGRTGHEGRLERYLSEQRTPLTSCSIASTVISDTVLFELKRARLRREVAYTIVSHGEQ